jgi:CxxC-x17-CxxC domain-containing protein
MHPATCADCGNQCEVPFKPTGEKPVFCSNCFEGGGRVQSRPSREPSRPRFDDKSKSNEDHQAIKSQIDRLESKLDKILKILAPVVPSEAKEVKEVVEKPVKKPAKKPAKKKVVKKAAPKKTVKKPAKKAAKKVVKKKK